MALSELEQVNAIIGLSKRIEGWPSTLADLGYSLERIELRLSVPDPKRPGTSIPINPDLLFLADQRNFSFIVELKSGRYQDLAQLNRLVGVKPIDLIRYGRVTLQDNAAILNHQISVIEIINREFLDEYLPEFQCINHKASLASIDPTIIKSHYGTLADQKADREFKNGIQLTNSYPPTRLLRVLPMTSDEYALVRSVVDAVKYLWVNNEPSATPLQVAQVEFRQIWGYFDNPAQRRYLSVAKETLRDMQQTEFHDYLRPVPQRNDAWRLVQLPESVEQKQQSRAMQNFQKAIQEYKWRRKNGQPYQYRRAAQPSLEDVEGFMPKEESESED